MDKRKKPAIRPVPVEVPVILQPVNVGSTSTRSSLTGFA